MYYILRDSVGYLKTSAKVTDPQTEKAFLFYEALHLERKQKEANADDK